MVEGTHSLLSRKQALDLFQQIGFHLELKILAPQEDVVGTLASE